MAEDDNAQKTVDPIRTIPPDARTIYVDSTRMALSPWDIRFHFGLLKEKEQGIVVDEEQAVVIMSPQHAKAVLDVLKSNIEKWEAAHGKIILSKSVRKELADQDIEQE